MNKTERLLSKAMADYTHAYNNACNVRDAAIEKAEAEYKAATAPEQKIFSEAEAAIWTAFNVAFTKARVAHYDAIEDAKKES